MKMHEPRDAGMRKILLSMIVLSFLLESLAVSPFLTFEVVAEPYKGVLVGDNFNYGNFKVWISPTGAQLFPEWKAFENITTVDFTLKGNPLPSEWTVYFDQEVTFKNGSSKTFDGRVDLQTGEGTGVLYFVLAGLNKGEMIYPQGAVANRTWTVNETRVDPQWSGREIYFFNSTSLRWAKTMLVYATTIIKWDKLTGVLLSVYDTKAGYGGPGTVVIEGGTRYELVATNRFHIEHSGVGEMLPIYVVVAVVLVVAVVVVAVRLSTSAPKKKWKKIAKE